MSSESEKLNVPSVFSATSFYTCMVLLLRLLLKLLDGNMFIPISCFCVCACVCVCVCASTLKHSSNSLTGHSDYITHSRWCRSSNMITNKAVCWVQIPQSQSSWMGRRSGREEEEGGGGAGLVGRCSRPNKELFIMIYSFPWWLIVLHRPVCGLRRPAHMFAEWHTVLSVSGCHVGMFGMPSLQCHTHSKLHCMMSTREDSNLHSNFPYWLWYCQSRMYKVYPKERIIIWGKCYFTSFPRLHLFIYTQRVVGGNIS